MQVRCNVDGAGFGQKPNKGQIGAIKGRLGFSRAEVTPEELAGYIQQGRSWTPAELKGTKKDDWISQQIIAVDVDNENHQTGQMIPDPVTPERAREVYAAAGLDPTIMHYSFSHKADWPKYRIIFFLDRVITDREQAEEYSRRVIAVLNKACPGCLDTITFNGDRLFFGGRPGCVCYNSGAVTALETLEALPASGYMSELAEEAAGPAAQQEPIKQGEPQELPQAQGRPLSIDEAKAEVKSKWREILPRYTTKAKKPANKEASFVCPICRHGKGGDGLTFYPKSGAHSLHCFTCDFTGDIIALVQRVRGLEFVPALRECCEAVGIVLEAPRGQQDGGTFGFDDALPAAGGQEAAGATESPQDVAEPAAAEESRQEAQEAPQEPTGPVTATQEARPDYTAYLERCRQELRGDGGAWGREYEERRGISVDTLITCGVAFDPAGDPANAPGALTDAGKRYPAPYMIFPTSNGGYSARRTDGREECEKVIAGPVGYFPVDALHMDRPGGVIFVTEGPNDAMSVFEAGYCGLALCSAGHSKALLDALEREPLADKPVFILALDNDAAGKKATEILKAGLDGLGYSYFVANISRNLKDPNEALQADRDAFGLDVATVAHRITSKRPNNTLWYLQNRMAQDVAEFGDPISTGFPELDRKLGGGLYKGLYVMGAVPGLGKTTFVLQMADRIATGGHDVLIFSLEMTRFELVSKSLSRILAEEKGLAFAPSALDIRRNKAAGKDIAMACDIYEERIGERISVCESMFSCDVNRIRGEVERYMQDTGERPVIILDYLQALRQDPQERPRLPIREFIDMQVQELVKMAKMYACPFVVVSSVNRQNYSQLFDYESLKESGGIEFTADCVLGMQLEILHDPIFDTKESANKKRTLIQEANKAKPKKVEITCLKNRYAPPNFAQAFDYYSRCDLFVEREEQSNQQASKPARKGGKK